MEGRGQGCYILVLLHFTGTYLTLNKWDVKKEEGPPWWLSGKESACQEAARRCGFNPQVGKIPWRRKWQPTQVVLPKKSHGTEEPGGLQSVGLQKSWT